jgi:hypothetical protein
LPLLFSHGLAIDGQSIFRCIYEALSEIHFVLEGYPTTSSNVNRFIEHFIASGQIAYENTAQPVASRKIHSAESRIFGDTLNESDALKMIRHVYETFSGYVHAQYQQIMEIYGGPPEDQKFQVHGFPTYAKRQSYERFTETAIDATENALAFIAFKLGLGDLFDQIRLRHK